MDPCGDISIHPWSIIVKEFDLRFIVGRSRNCEDKGAKNHIFIVLSCQILMGFI